MTNSKVRILGHGPQMFTSIERAQRYVKRGQAKWEGGNASIRFVSSNHRAISAAASERNGALQAMAGYDANVASTLLGRDGMKHLPMGGGRDAYERLMQLKTKRNVAAQ